MIGSQSYSSAAISSVADAVTVSAFDSVVTMVRGITTGSLPLTTRPTGSIQLTTKPSGY